MKVKPNKYCRGYSLCPVKSFFERGILEEKWIMDYCLGNWNNCIRFQMEERGDHHPDTLLPDGTVLRLDD